LLIGRPAMERVLAPLLSAGGNGDEQPSDFLYGAEQPAMKQRTASEVFFTKDARPAAEATAKLLAPMIGPTEVKPWPGDWDYHVVVVVGTPPAK
jgi:hypothetical protein